MRLARRWRCACPAAATVARAEEPLGHDGRWITDAQRARRDAPRRRRHPGRLRRQAARDRGGGRVQEGRREVAARHGFNVVRLGAFYGGYEREPGPVHGELHGQLRAHAAAARPPRDLHALRLPPGHAQPALPGPRLRGLVHPGRRASELAAGRLPRQLLPQLRAQPRLRQPLGERGRARTASACRTTSPRGGGGWRRASPDARTWPATTSSTSRGPGSAWPTCANTEGCPPGGFDSTALTDVPQPRHRGDPQGGPHAHGLLRAEPPVRRRREDGAREGGRPERRVQLPQLLPRRRAGPTRTRPTRPRSARTRASGACSRTPRPTSRRPARRS